MGQNYNYTSQTKALPQRLESTAPANPISTKGAPQTATASSNRYY